MSAVARAFPGSTLAAPPGKRRHPASFCTALRPCTRAHLPTFCISLRPCTRAHLPTFCMSLRGAKRRGNPYSLQQHKTKSNSSRQIRRSCEFALCTTVLPGISAGTRIATPVCALVRNDMLKAVTCQRLQGRFPAVPWQRPLANADTRQVSACHCVLAPAHTCHVSACHCEERSDVAIRTPCGRT